jgi:hypothetical protein
VLVAIDHFSKYAEAYPVKEYTAVETVHQLMNNWFARWGPPTSVQSDNGTAFANALNAEFLAVSQVVEVHSTPYHPACNGAVERMNRTLAQLLRVWGSTEQSKWDEFLPVALSAYNATRHASTGFSPNMLMLGRETADPLAYFYPVHDEFSNTEPGAYVEQLIKRQAVVRRIARHNLKQAQIRQKRNFDKRIKSLVTYKPGDSVQVRTRVCLPGQCRKLKDVYKGPYVIAEVLQKGRCYRLETGQRVHFEQLRRWNNRLTDYKLPIGAKELQYEPDGDVDSIAPTEGASTIIEQDLCSNAADDLADDFSPLQMRDPPPGQYTLRPRKDTVRYREPSENDSDIEEEHESCALWDVTCPEDILCVDGGTHPYFVGGEPAEIQMRNNVLLYAAQVANRRRFYNRPEKAANDMFRYALSKDNVIPEYSTVITYMDGNFLQTEHSMAMATAADMSMRGPLIGNLSRSYGNKDALFNQRKQAGQTAVLTPWISGRNEQYLFYLLVKNTKLETTQTDKLAKSLLDLRAMLLSLEITKIAVSTVDTGLDGITWPTMYEMLHIVFENTNIQVLAYRHFYTPLLFTVNDVDSTAQCAQPATATITERSYDQTGTERSPTHTGSEQLPDQTSTERSPTHASTERLPDQTCTRRQHDQTSTERSSVLTSMERLPDQTGTERSTVHTVTDCQPGCTATTSNEAYRNQMNVEQQRTDEPPSQFNRVDGTKPTKIGPARQ